MQVEQTLLYGKEGGNSKTFYSCYHSLHNKGSSQAYAPCKLEILMCIKRSQGIYVTNKELALFELSKPAGPETAGKKIVAFGMSLLQDSNTEFPLHSKTPSPLSTPPLTCAYAFFVLISKSVRTLMYYTWGNLTQYAVLKFQEDVVIFDASNFCFVSFPNRTKKKKKLEARFLPGFPSNKHLSPAQMTSVEMSKIFLLYDSRNYTDT